MPFYWWTNFAPKKDKSLRGNGGKGGAQPRTTCPDCTGSPPPQRGAPRLLEAWMELGPFSAGEQMLFVLMDTPRGTTIKPSRLWWPPQVPGH